MITGVYKGQKHHKSSEYEIKSYRYKISRPIPFIIKDIIYLSKTETLK